ncbi:MAG: GDSL-type esterase/lipase family protein [Planctomycetota bacterium]
MTAPANAPSRRPSAGRRALTALVGLVALVALTEIALRALGLPRAKLDLQLIDADAADRTRLPPDPETCWRLGTDQDWGAPLNRFGLRGSEPDDVKSERHFRIAVVGGSAAFGGRVDHDLTFAAQTELAVQDELPQARVEALLMAVPGFTTLQSLRLWQAAGPAFAPDLVVLYCGLDDCAPAVIAPDAEVLAAYEHPPRWHLLRLLRDLRRDAPSAEQRQRMLDDDEAPRGRRVPPAAFEANVVALIDAARTVGAEVCVVVPATSERRRVAPVLEEYRAALRRAAQARSSFVVDADALAKAYESSMDRAPCSDVGSGHALRDDRELSPEGHALLAQLLLTRARAHSRFSALASLPTLPTPAAASLEPAAVDAAAGGEVRLTGKGLAQAAGLRAWLGDQSVPALRVLDDEHAVLTVPRELVPGEHRLRLCSINGESPATESVALTVRPRALEVSLQRDGGALRVELSGHAPAGSKVCVYVAAAGRSTPAATRAGPFWLQTDAPGTTPPRAPFCFGSLPFTHFEATSGTDSSWLIRSSWEADDRFANAVFQGVAWLPGDRLQGLVTEVAVRVVPR